MIGFEITANGTNGFKWKSGAWTEGSLIALKGALSIPKVNPPGMGGSKRGIIDSIEAGFNRIGKALLNKVCADGMNFTLFVSGDMMFKYYFDYSKKSDQIKSEFLQMIATYQKEIGDQVMIHMCRTIQDFFLHNIRYTGGPLILNMKVDL